MKGTRFIASAVALGAVMMASTAAAQNTSTAAAGVQFGVAGGLSQPTGDMGDFTSTGFNVTGMLGFNPAALPFGLRLDVSWNQFAFDDEVGFDGNVRALGGALNAILKLPATSVSPYIIAGPGFYNIDLNFDDVEEEDAELDESKFAIQAGAGLQFNLAGMASILEAKYVNVFTSDESTAFIPVTFGILFGGGGTTASGSRVRTR